MKYGILIFYFFHHQGWQVLRHNLNGNCEVLHTPGETDLSGHLPGWARDVLVGPFPQAPCFGLNALCSTSAEDEPPPREGCVWGEESAVIYASLGFFFI